MNEAREKRTDLLKNDDLVAGMVVDRFKKKSTY